MTKQEYINKHRDIVDEASRRMAELRRAKEATPALVILQDWTGKAHKIRFNKKLTRTQLERSVAEAKRFVKAKSSTVEGMREIRLGREMTLGRVVDQYKQTLTANTTDFFRVLSSEQFKRAVKEANSDIIIAYVNRQISKGMKPSTVKGLLTRSLSDATMHAGGDTNAAVTRYLREKWHM